MTQRELPVIRWAAALALLALAAGACDRERDAPDPDSHPRQVVVIGADADEYVLRENRGRVGMYPLNASICETLVRLTPGFRVEPWLATRWEYRGDNTYRFHLRRGVRFHDGRPFDARAVKHSLDRPGTVQYSFLSAESVTIVNDSTVDIRPALPNLRLVDQLVHPTYSMVAPGNDGRNPVCTGPFRLVEYVPEDRLSVARYEDYWGDKGARLDTLTFRFFPDGNTRSLALRSGQVDGIVDVHRATAAALERTPGIRVVHAPTGAVLMMYMARRGAPGFDLLGERAVRRAVALALDRQALAERILDGRAVPVRTVNPPAVLGPWVDRLQGIPFDPDEARELLDDAGWEPGPDGVRRRNGRALELALMPLPNAVDPEVAQYVHAALRDVGIGVRIDMLDRAVFSTRLNAGRFDLDIELPNQNDANPAFLLTLRWYSKSEVASARFMLAGTRFDAHVEQALGATDPDSVRAHAAEAMRILLEEEVAAIPLAGLFRIYAFREGVEGFEPHPSKTNQGWSSVHVVR